MLRVGEIGGVEGRRVFLLQLGYGGLELLEGKVVVGRWFGCCLVSQNLKTVKFSWMVGLSADLN